MSLLLRNIIEVLCLDPSLRNNIPDEYSWLNSQVKNDTQVNKLQEIAHYVLWSQIMPEADAEIKMHERVSESLQTPVPIPLHGRKFKAIYGIMSLSALFFAHVLRTSK